MDRRSLGGDWSGERGVEGYRHLETGAGAGDRDNLERASERPQALAHAATIAIVHDRTVSDLHEVNVQLQCALNSRVIIEQAKGALAERAGIGVDEAFERLRAYARARNLKLTRVAEAVATHTMTKAEIATLVGGST